MKQTNDPRGRVLHDTGIEIFKTTEELQIMIHHFCSWGLKESLSLSLTHTHTHQSLHAMIFFFCHWTQKKNFWRIWKGQTHIK